MENKANFCYALIKESHEKLECIKLYKEKLEYIKLYKNKHDAYIAMWEEIRNMKIIRPTYRNSSCTHEIIFDIDQNIYFKWYIKEIEI